MSELLVSLIERLKGELPKGALEALPRLVGGSTAAGRLWRFFSPQTVARWNTPETWRGAWPGLSPELFFFGEDIFGNQLTLKPGNENVWLWNHENGELVDLLLDPATLLETVIESGVDWIDFYSPQMLAVGRAKLLDVPENCHLHWTQPLILGGAVSATNTSIVENAMHLRGHGALWAQLHRLPPGTEVVIKPQR
jgi:hypothetical protein